MNFSGSYQPADVTFLLKPVRLATTDVAEKERLIQSGQRHYSEMIGPEAAPSAPYLRVFHEAFAREKSRFARDVLILARHIAARRPSAVTIVSLARAGTPVGVLVGRTLRRLLNRPAPHYSVSIIRDRGLDETALAFIRKRHGAESIVFVDGWTGKGVIARELRRALATFNVDPGLYTVADLCGAAAFASTSADYLIPSSVLGATISGLVSRSILNDAVIGPGDFHGCLYLEDLGSLDLSRWFVDEVFREIECQAHQAADDTGVSAHELAGLQQTSDAFLAAMAQRYGVRHVNHIKPGVGEATRVLLRRVPQCLLLRDANAVDVAHLLILAAEKNVPILVDASLPYAAAALIKEMDG